MPTNPLSAGRCEMSWQARESVEGSGHLDIVDEQGRTVALVHRRRDMSRAEYKANAALLAEAPDLKAFEASVLPMRGEIEAVHEENERLRAALTACVQELAYVHDCEVWINRGEERYAAIMGGRDALAAPRAAEDLERCRAALRLVMEWWAAHEFDAIPLGDGDERNAYDEEPAMVKAAREALK